MPEVPSGTLAPQVGSLALGKPRHQCAARRD